MNRTTPVMRAFRWQFVLALMLSSSCTSTLNSPTVTKPPEQHATHVMEGSDLYRVIVEESTTHHWLFGEQKTTKVIEKTKLEPGSGLKSGLQPLESTLQRAE